MSVLPGRIRQNGYVVRDLDAAMGHWLDVLGVGPWFVLRNLEPDEYEHRGKPSMPRISIALANSGDLQLELIEQHNDEASLYREFLDAGYEGLHHHAWWTPDFDDAVAAAEAAGWEIGGRGHLGPTKFAYFDTEEYPGTIAELMVLDEVTGPFMDAVRDAAETWDGETDPIRQLN